MCFTQFQWQYMLQGSLFTLLEWTYPDYDSKASPRQIFLTRDSCKVTRKRGSWVLKILFRRGCVNLLWWQAGFQTQIAWTMHVCRPEYIALKIMFKGERAERRGVLVITGDDIYSAILLTSLISFANLVPAHRHSSHSYILSDCILHPGWLLSEQFCYLRES